MEKFRFKDVKSKFDLQIIFFMILLVIIFFAVFQTIYTMQYSATGLYFDYASNIAHGLFPYRDFQIEYPPFSLVFFLFPSIFTADSTTYGYVFQAEVLLFAIIGLIVLNDIARRVGQPPWKLMAIYIFGILAIGPIVTVRYDLFPALMVLLSVYLFWLNKHEAAWGLLALATMTKIFPIVIAPLFLISYIRNRRYRLVWRGIITFALVNLLVLLPFLILAPEGFWGFVTYHANRGLQLETIYSSLLLLANKIGLITVSSGFSFDAWHIEGSAANIVAGWSTGILILFVLLSYWFFYKRNQPGKVDIFRLGSFSFLVILTILITSKILSPEYLVWLIPLLPLMIGRWRNVIVVMFAVVGGLTYLLFPLMYLQLVAFQTDAVVVLILRNLLLITIVVFAVVSLRIKPEAQDQAIMKEKCPKHKNL